MKVEKHEPVVGGGNGDELLLGTSSWSDKDTSLKYGWLDKNGRFARGGEMPTWAIPQAVVFAAREEYLTVEQTVELVKSLSSASSFIQQPPDHAAQHGAEDHDGSCTHGLSLYGWVGTPLASPSSFRLLASLPWHRDPFDQPIEGNPERVGEDQQRRQFRFALALSRYWMCTRFMFAFRANASWEPNFSLRSARSVAPKRFRRALRSLA